LEVVLGFGDGFTAERAVDEAETARIADVVHHRSSEPTLDWAPAGSPSERSPGRSE
jgi:hypothetical protein